MDKAAKKAEKKAKEEEKKRLAEEKKKKKALEKQRAKEEKKKRKAGGGGGGSDTSSEPASTIPDDTPPEALEEQQDNPIVTPQASPATPAKAARTKKKDSSPKATPPPSNGPSPTPKKDPSQKKKSSSPASTKSASSSPAASLEEKAAAPAPVEEKKEEVGAPTPPAATEKKVDDATPPPVEEEQSKKESDSGGDTPAANVTPATPSVDVIEADADSVPPRSSFIAPDDKTGSPEPSNPPSKNTLSADKKGIQRSNSGRRSLHRAPATEAPGVHAVQSAPQLDSVPDEEEENNRELDIVEDDCDERVGEMSSANADATAAYLADIYQQLRERMTQLHANGTNMGYSQSYQAMNSLGRNQPAEASFREANKLKNRYGNITAYDHSRVQLPVINDDPDTNYINANWINGYNRERAYIASQGPVPNSFISFWRMIWAEEIQVVAMVTHEIENNRMKCHRYWPDPTSMPPVKTLQYGSIYVTHKSSVPHKHFIVREFEVRLGDETRHLKQFAYTSWPDHGVPLTTAELLGFRNAVRTSCPDKSKPLLVHCSAGVGRTGTYIAIDRLVEQALDMGGTLDIDAVVKDMRMARNFMVQTEIQYMFIYRAVLDALSELLSGESKKASMLERAKQAEEEAAEALKRAADEARRAEQEREQTLAQEKKDIEEARKELTARMDNTAAGARKVVVLSIKERMELLNNAEQRWLESYRQSIEEWNERNKFEAEEYDLTSSLTPIQSRIEALRQKGLFEG